MHPIARLIPIALLAAASVALAQQQPAPQLPASQPPPAPAAPATQAQLEALNHRLDELQKKLDDTLWYERVGDVAVVDKVRLYGPPKWKEKNPNALGAGNPFKFWTYVFTPRAEFGGAKLPLVVLPHGGVHGDFDTYYVHVVRELIAQGYVVVAPDYRGSTGYGRDLYEAIDYGGREVDDTLAARNWAAEHHPRVDKTRVGIVGWSHGGLITLMSLFDHPEAYVAGFAGVPVSDLVMRLGYYDDEYRALFSAPYFIGQPVGENLAEYKRRSPVWHVEKLNRPLRVHGNKSDEDVNVIEVERLIAALKAAGKTFEAEIYDLPGGHSFDRLDTPEAWKVRKEIYAFLARHLKPPRAQIPLGLTPAGVAAP